MPHLAPLNWLFIPVMFWVFLASTFAAMWWFQTLKFPSIKPTVYSFSRWNWDLSK